MNIWQTVKRDFFQRTGICFFFVLVALTTPANAEDRITKITNIPQRNYLNDLSPLPRIQDKRRIKIRYDHVIEMGQTRIILRLKASPKPRKIVQIELRF